MKIITKKRTTRIRVIKERMLAIFPAFSWDKGCKGILIIWLCWGLEIDWKLNDIITIK